MGTFVIKSQTTNAQYEYKNDSIIVQGSISKDASNYEIQSINGSCYRKEGEAIGEYIGNFNGYPRDGKIKYSVSEMTHDDSTLVWNAIEDIESEIMPQS